MNPQQFERHEQYTLGLQRGMNDATEGRDFKLSPCSAEFEQGYRLGYDSITKATAKTATPTPSANLQAYVKCCADRDRLKSDRARLIEALRGMTDKFSPSAGVYSNSTLCACLNNARSLLRELEGK